MTDDHRNGDDSDHSDHSDDSHLREHRTGASTLLAGGWLQVQRDDVRLPDGSHATREYIRHSGAVAVIPLLGDVNDGPALRVVMVRQFRYPVGKVLLEFPAGKLDAGESVVTCGMRELREETGYQAAEWAYGGEIHNAPAYSDESIWLWFARGLTAGAAQLDSGEFVETVLLTVDELQALADRNELPDVKTQIGLAWLQRWRSGQRTLAWQSAAAAATADAAAAIATAIATEQQTPPPPQRSSAA